MTNPQEVLDHLREQRAMSKSPKVQGIEVLFDPNYRGKLPISREDMAAYMKVVGEAFEVHLDRERIRHGLWKDYPAKDQNFQVTVKADRIKRALETEDLTTEEIVEVISEAWDIVNYAIFAIRKLRGE